MTATPTAAPLPSGRARALWHRRELLVHALIFAIVPWSAVLLLVNVPAFAESYGRRPGTDFVHFYILGKAATARDATLLYDAVAQRKMQGTYEPSQPGWYVPIYGPQTSLAFAPLALLPYRVALWLWRGLTLAGYCAVVWLLWRHCTNLRGSGVVVLVAAAGFPPLRQLLLFGQSTLLPLAAIGIARPALRSNRDGWAGAALSLLLVKPQLGLVFAVWALVERRWLLIFSGLAAALAQVAVAWLWFGPEAITSYLRMLLSLPHLAPLLEPDPEQLHSLRGLLTSLVPVPLVWPLWAVISFGAIWLAIRAWRGPAGFELRYAVLVVASVLVSPHLAGYEAVLLAPALLVIADWVVREPRAAPVARGLYALYLLLLVPTAFIVHVQLSVFALAFVLVGTTVIASRGSEELEADGSGRAGRPNLGG